VQTETTSWEIVRAAAGGTRRDEFAARYSPLLRAYLGSRWRSSPRVAMVDDAVQEVFIECFRTGGVLEKADDARPGGFRALLYGVVRNVARRFELRDAPGEQYSSGFFETAPANEASLSACFDRAWAEAMLAQARQRLMECAELHQGAAERRAELLRLRYHEGLPIREIASRWGVDRSWLHQECLRARREFKRALLEVLAEHQPGSKEEIEAECRALLRALG